MASLSASGYEQLLAALRSDALVEQVATMATTADRRRVLANAIAPVLATENLTLTDVFDPADLSLLDAPVDANTMQLRLNLQIQLQVLKRPSQASQHLPSDQDVRDHAFAGKRLA